MRKKKVRKLLNAVPSAVNHSEQLLIDVTTTLSKVGKKRSSRSLHVYRFVLLGGTMSKEAQEQIHISINEHLRVTHLVEVYDNNEIEVCIVGVDFPDLEELDIRVAAAIGFFLGYAPEDVLLFVDDGAGSKELIEIGEIYEVLLCEDERESVPAPVLAAVA